MRNFSIAVLILTVFGFALGGYLEIPGISDVSVFGVIVLFFCAVFSCFSYLSHSDDLGIVRAQNEVVIVYQDKIDRLSKRLDTFNYPKGSLLNADSPVAAIVSSLTQAENDLAKAKSAKAKAIRRIAQREAGPFKFIVDRNGKE